MAGRSRQRGLLMLWEPEMSQEEEDRLVHWRKSNQIDMVLVCQFIDCKLDSPQLHNTEMLL